MQIHESALQTFGHIQPMLCSMKVPGVSLIYSANIPLGVKRIGYSRAWAAKQTAVFMHKRNM